METQLSTQRPKSEKRLRYDEVVNNIRARHGSLEEMRARLKFSQKQMSELLLVDPSAWTRWVKDGESAPAHIYQALAWYFESQVVKENAALKSINWKLPQTEILESFDFEAWKEEKSQLMDQIKAAQTKTAAISDGWKLFLIINTLLLLYVFLSR